MPRSGQTTVKHHLANARSKIGADTAAQPVWILALRLPKPMAPTSGAGSGPGRPDR